MKNKNRTSLSATELSNSDIQQIESSMPTEHNYLKDLLEQCPPDKMKRDKEDDDWLN